MITFLIWIHLTSQILILKLDEDCTDGNKFSHHALIQCPRARDLRQAMGQHWLLSDDERFQYTGKDWLLLLLDSYWKEQRDLILFLRWRAWYVHNNITHGIGPTSTTKSVGFLLNLRESLIKSTEPIPKGTTSARTSGPRSTSGCPRWTMFPILAPAFNARARTKPKKNSTPPPASRFHMPMRGPRRQTTCGDRSCPLRFSYVLQHVQHRSSFEISRYNTCNIRLKTNETLGTCVWNTWNMRMKHLEKPWNHCAKHTQHPDKTLATYVWNICNIQINTLVTCVWKKCGWNI
jgi:hypothetical protein